MGTKICGLARKNFFVLDMAKMAVTPVTAVTPHVGIFPCGLVYIDV